MLEWEKKQLRKEWEVLRQPSPPTVSLAQQDTKLLRIRQQGGAMRQLQEEINRHRKTCGTCVSKMTEK